MFCFLNIPINLPRPFCIVSVCPIKSSKVIESIYCSLDAIVNWVSTSKADPRETSKKCAKSKSELLQEPSEMLDDIDTTALSN